MQVREIEGNSHFLNSILEWPVSRGEKKSLCIVCIQNFQIYAFNLVMSPPSLLSPPHWSFTKKEAPTTLFPSMLTISIGRDTKLHHHIRWDRAIQLHVFKSTITLKKKKKKGDYINPFKLTCLSYALLWPSVKKITRRYLIYSIHWAWGFFAKL